jgi:hypothetical protein
MSMISFALSLVPRPIIDDYMPFDKEKLFMLKGGNKETLPKREIVKNFFDSSKRNLIVYMIINRINIETALSSNNHYGHRELIIAGVFTDLLALHDGPNKSSSPANQMSRKKGNSVDSELGEIPVEREKYPQETKENLRMNSF